ncbi:MAG TPA: glycosyltransferase [Vicinamibacteria bacterium]|nr:glycosyltransferase [Vicinamibacteria bacterium]
MRPPVPRVSILLPVRDAAATLRECLDSLGGQSLRDHEVVAVDDGSTDATAAVLDDAARRDRRVRSVRTPPRGIVAALDAALQLARGPLVARMDADDIAHPDRLARQAVRLTEDARTDVLGCRVRLFGATGRGMRAYVEWLNALLDHEAIVRDLYVESPLVHPSVMMRAADLRALGGYRAFDGPEDYDLWLRAHARGLRFGKDPEVLLHWRDGRERLTRRDPRYAPARFRALKLAALEQGPLRRARPVVVWGAGPVGKGWARALAARGHRVSAFVEVDPRKLGRTLHGAPVVPLAAAAGFPGALHLAAVGRPGARERIRAAAASLGLPDGDLVAVA